MNIPGSGMITISHQYGSGGSLIARALGRQLNWSVWDKEIVHRIATENQLAEEDVDDKDERVETFMERLTGVLGLSAFETAYSVLPPRWLTDAQLVRMTREIVTDIATQGSAIIVGRGGNHLLAARPATLHVFVVAPLAERIQTVMRVEQLTQVEAERRIAGMDKLRADYVRTFYHAEWSDPTFYHVLVNSAAWGEAAVVDLILDALARMPLLSHESTAQASRNVTSSEFYHS